MLAEFVGLKVRESSVILPLKLKSRIGYFRRAVHFVFKDFTSFRTIAQVLLTEKKPQKPERWP